MGKWWAAELRGGRASAVKPQRTARVRMIVALYVLYGYCLMGVNLADIHIMPNYTRYPYNADLDIHITISIYLGLLLRYAHFFDWMIISYYHIVLSYCIIVIHVCIVCTVYIVLLLVVDYDFGVFAVCGRGTPLRARTSLFVLTQISTHMLLLVSCIYFACSV